MSATQEAVDDTSSPVFDAGQLEAIATAIANGFGLGEELETSEQWPVDSGDRVLGFPFDGSATGSLLLAVNIEVSERLLADRERVVAEVQKALDAVDGHSLQLGEIGETTERPTTCVHIKDRGEACALVGVADAGVVEVVEFSGEALDVAPRRGRQSQGPLEISPEDLRLLEKLGDVEVVVKAELGRTTMSVKTVLGLLPGTVFELGSVVGDPIDLMVGDSVVGFGDVVVADENFGVRIVGTGGGPTPVDGQ